MQIWSWPLAWENEGLGYFNLHFVADRWELSNSYDKHDYFEIGFSKNADIIEKDDKRIFL